MDEKKKNKITAEDVKILCQEFDVEYDDTLSVEEMYNKIKGKVEAV